MSPKQFFNHLLRPTGYELARNRDHPDFPGDFAPEEIETIRAVRGFTMSKTVDKIYPIINASRHIIQRGIPGAVVECGVWRGGMMMAAAYTFLKLGDSTRDLHLFDTFEGMVQPTEKDTDIRGKRALSHYEQAQRMNDGAVDWCYASLEEVKRNLDATGYPPHKIHFIKGRVEETLPARAPDQIAILRLDTDWYESSKHELEHLYPRLVLGGILILDDYGFWKGCREATDEYFAKHDVKLHLVRVDESCRVGVKV
jgi:O-methyltransferase